MQAKKALVTLFFLLILLSGCELMRASQTKDLSMNDVSGMFREGGNPGAAEEPVTLSGQLHKFNDWLKQNLW